jgi:diguanylate cyclase (GGDEF)-like protein
MLARLGGDEFGALIRVRQGRTEAEEIAHRLERCFDEPISVKNHIIQGSASIGIAMFPEDATSDDGLMSIADAAMYGKKRQRNRPGAKTGGEVTRLIIQSRDRRSGS